MAQEHKYYFDLDKRVLDINDVLNDLVDILKSGGGEEGSLYNKAIIFRESGTSENMPNKGRDQFDLGEAGGGGKVDGKLGQIIVSNGEGWLQPTSLIVYPYNQADYQRTIQSPGNYPILLSGSANPTVPPIFNFENNQNSFVFKIEDSAQVLFSEQSQLSVSGQAKIFADGNTRFTLHDQAWIDINQNAKVKIGGASELFVDGLSYGQQNENEKYDPKVHIHGGVISFGNVSNSTQVSNWNGTTSRAPWAWAYDGRRHIYAWDEGTTQYNEQIAQYGPYFHMYHKSTVIMDGAPVLKMTGKPAFIMDGNPVLAVRDYSRVDIENGSRVHISGKYEGSSSLLNGDRDTLIRSPYLFIDQYQLMYYSVQPTTPLMQTGNEIDTSVINSFFDGTDATGGSYIAADHIGIGNIMREVPQLQWKGTIWNTYKSNNYWCPGFLLQGDTVLRLGAGSTANTAGGKTRIYLGPQKGGQLTFDITPNEYSTTAFQISPGIGCKTYFDISPDTGSQTLVKFGGSENSVFVINATPYDYSRTYINFAPGKSSVFNAVIDPPNGSFTGIKFAPEGRLQYQLTGTDIFVQHTGQFHAEFHDRSTIVMRGILGKDKDNNQINPWEEGKDWAYGNPEWQKWNRPVQNRGGGPLNAMYDQSTFTMRGRWTYEDIEAEQSTDETYVYKVSPYSTSSLYGKTKLTWNDLLSDASFAGNLIYYKKFPPYTGDISVVSEERKDTVITISNLTYYNKDPKWKMEIDRMPGSPILEVSDEAEVRISGDVVIKADTIIENEKRETLITFADSKVSDQTVSFTIEELKSLKTLVKSIVVTSDQEEEVKQKRDDIIYFVVDKEGD